MIFVLGLLVGIFSGIGAMILWGVVIVYNVWHVIVSRKFIDNIPQTIIIMSERMDKRK